MDDVTFVVLGATGDLTKRKLIPAFYALIKSRKIKKFALVGAARSLTTAKEIIATSQGYVKNKDMQAWNRLLASAYYQQLDFSKKENYVQLGTLLSRVERKHKLSGDRIFYLAAAPEHFDTITFNLQKSEIARETQRKWIRVVYEKPFGWDLRSALAINDCIRRVFKEKQIYRIDHYLGKELVGNIAFIRFTNRILEPLWSRKDINSVQIILDENVGLEGRGEFYEKYGALKDVVQNHALQLLALTAMESPVSLNGEHIRQEKAKVLQKVRVRDALFGQYHGYRMSPGVAKDSPVNTFVALQAEINNERWRGVPFFIRAGKFLGKKETSIHLQFKEVNCLLARACPSDTNYFTIRIEPKDGFSFEVNSKVPGERNLVNPVVMDFCQGCQDLPNTPGAYENLLEDVIKGDQSVFVRHDEIEHAWKVIEQVKPEKFPLYSYQKGSKGPQELEQWNKKHAFQWHT